MYFKKTCFSGESWLATLQTLLDSLSKAMRDAGCRVVAEGGVGGSVRRLYECSNGVKVSASLTKLSAAPPKRLGMIGEIAYRTGYLGPIHIQISAEGPSEDAVGWVCWKIFMYMARGGG